MVLVASSVLQLSSKRIKELGIKIIEYPVFVNGERYKASIDMSLEEKSKLRDIIKDKNNKVTTAGLGHDDLFNIYNAHKNEKIIHMEQSINITKATGEVMKQVAQENPKLDLVQFDTNKISVAYSIQVLEAAKALKKGMPYDKFIKFITKNRENTGHLGVIYDLFFLQRSGRISFAKALLGTAFKIIPLLGATSESGGLKSVGKAKTYLQANQIFLHMIEEDMKAKKGKRISVLIAYCGDHEKEALHMKELILSKGWETEFDYDPAIEASAVEVYYTNHSNMPHQGPDFYDIGYIIYED